MNILMISIGDDILKRPVGDGIDRHLEYTRYANGQIHMITYSSAKCKLPPRHFEDRFFVYPSVSLSVVTFLYDAYHKASALCRRIQFDVTYTQDPFGTALVGRWLRNRFGIPFIIGNHSDFIDNSYWIAERPVFFSFLNRLAKYILPKADAWRVVNENQKKLYVRELQLPADRIYVRNTPVNMDRFLQPVEPSIRLQIRARLDIAPDDPVLLWVGRPVRFKRLPILLQAFWYVVEQLPNATLVLIGDKQLVQEDIDSEIMRLHLKDRLRWVEEGVEHTELPGYYQMADVYVQTSQYEGCCKAIIEAAMSGLAIVSTDAAASGTRGLIRQNQTGILVPVDDAKLIAEKVVWLFTNPEQASQMGAQGKQKASEIFDRGQNIKDIVTMWQEVAFSGKNRANQEK